MAFYGAVAILGIIVFEFVSGAMWAIGLIVLIPYCAFVLLMTLFSAWFSPWYLPKTGLLEAIAIPEILPFASAMVSGLAFSFVLEVLPNDEAVHIATPIIEVVGFGLYSSMMFLFGSGLVIFPAAGIASAILRKSFSHITA